MMRPWTISRIFFLILAGGLGAFLLFLLGTRLMDEPVPTKVAISFSDIPEWAGDNHAAAFAAFRRSCERIIQVNQVRAGKGKEDTNPLNDICKAALEMGADADIASARRFFETHFTPHRFTGKETAGFVTGYYEPELKGSRTKSERYFVPVYGVPDDLEQLYPDSERAKRNHEMTAGRRTAEGMVPYYDRKEIEQGALEGRGFEILYLDDWADAFYMHIQGSGRVALEEGGHVRLGFGAKNGHSYTAIGKHLIERGAISRDEMSMDAVRTWLEANGDEARELMWENRSYIFFRELDPAVAAIGPVGAQGVALSPRRSLAVDTSLHRLGTPIWVRADNFDLHGQAGFSQLMIAQDAGSAIKGPGRGDIFWGSGQAAGEIAGAMRHPADFIVLLPNSALGE
jgi:membrane-bound lytic murein transglycosylase A